MVCKHEYMNIGTVVNYRVQRARYACPVSIMAAILRTLGLIFSAFTFAFVSLGLVLIGLVPIFKITHTNEYCVTGSEGLPKTVRLYLHDRNLYLQIDKH